MFTSVAVDSDPNLVEKTNHFKIAVYSFTVSSLVAPLKRYLVKFSNRGTQYGAVKK